MMKNNLLALSSVAALAACTQPTLSVSGQLENLPNCDIYLSVLDSNLRPVTIDTATVLNGRFAFGKRAMPAEECLLITDNRSVSFGFFAGNDDVTITGDVSRYNEIEVSGSETNDMIMDFKRGVPYKERIQEINRELRATGNDVDMREALHDELEHIRAERAEYMKRFVMENSGSPVSAFLVVNHINDFRFTAVDTFLQCLKKEIPAHKYVRSLARAVEKMRPEYEANELVSVGRIAPEFTLHDVDSAIVKLSDMRGKVVFVNFWASWSPESRHDNATLVEAYRKFAEKGVQFVWVSVDLRHSDWKRAVAMDNLPGIQLHDCRNLVAATYRVKNLPSNFLIDAEGRIVAKSNKHDKVMESIEKLLQ